MNPDEQTPVQSPVQPPEASLELPSLETVASPRRQRRRWWRRLLVCCLLGGAAYGLLLYRGQTGPLEGWLMHLTHVAYAAYERLPRLGQAPTQSPKPADIPAQGSKPVQTPAQGGKPAEAPEVRAVPVVATAARQANMGVYLTGLGSVTAFNTVTVRARVDGQLIKVAFQEGQLVRKGDLLAEIDPRPYQVQLAQAEGQLAKDEAQLKNAMVDLERYKVLLAQDSVAKQQLDTQIATVQQYEGIIKSDQAQIDNAKLLLTYTRITAPISGRLGLRLVDEGNMVRSTDQTGLAVIMQLQPIAVLFNIPEDDLPSVLKKMQAEQQLVVEAYNRDLKKKLATGKLLTIDNQIDANTGTIRCKAIFSNEDNTLFPNQFVNARLLVETKQDATIVPASAVQRSVQSTFVYVVKDDSTVEVRNVVLGPTEGDDVSIDNGLAPGEVVIIEGVDRVQRGMKVAPRMAIVGSAKGSK
jgi:membrane fusion protein, multidrug efflux system